MLATFLDGTPGFEAALARLEHRGLSDFARVEPAVREILAAVRAEGDAAVHRYNERFGRRTPASSIATTRGARRSPACHRKSARRWNLRRRASARSTSANATPASATSKTASPWACACSPWRGPAFTRPAARRDTPRV